MPPLFKRRRLNDDNLFISLPDEVLLFIFRYLDSPDLLNCRSVSRTWSEPSKMLLHSRKSASSVNDKAESQPRFSEFTTERMVEGEPSLLQLPDEMIIHIFTFLDPVELLKCSKVSKLWYNLSRNALRSVRSIKFEPSKCTRLIYYENSWKLITCEKKIDEALNTFKGIVEEVQCKVSLNSSGDSKVLMDTLAALNKLTNLKGLSWSMDICP